MFRLVTGNDEKRNVFFLDALKYNCTNENSTVISLIDSGNNEKNVFEQIGIEIAFFAYCLLLIVIVFSGFSFWNLFVRFH